MKDDKRKDKRKRRRRIMRVTVDVDLGDSSRTPSRDEEDNSSAGGGDDSGPSPGPSGGTAAPTNQVIDESGHQEDAEPGGEVTDDPEAEVIEYIEVPEGEVSNDANVPLEGEAEVDVEADAEHEGRPPQPSVVEPRQPAPNPDLQRWVRVRARLSTWNLACDSQCGRVCSARRQK